MPKFRIKSLILSFVLALSPILIYFIYDWQQFLSTPVLPQNQSFVYLVKPGNSLRRVSNDLHRFGIIKQPRYFVLLGFVKGSSKQLKASNFFQNQCRLRKLGWIFSRRSNSSRTISI